MAALLLLVCAEADHRDSSCAGVGDYNHGRQGAETNKQERARDKRRARAKI